MSKHWSKYWWVITKDHLDGNEAGIKGPSNCQCGNTINPAHFSMYDDDGILYYDGVIFGDYTGLEPLDDFGMPNAGCTSINVNGVLV